MEKEKNIPWCHTWYRMQFCLAAKRWGPHLENRQTAAISSQGGGKNGNSMKRQRRQDNQEDGGESEIRYLFPANQF